MPVNLYDATDVIPSGFEGTAFEPVLKAVAEVCGAPFDTQTPNSTVYRMAAVYALAHGMDDLLIGDSDILNQLAAALRIPAWRQLVRAEGEDKRRLACRTLRIWLNYRGLTGGRVPSSPAVVYDDGTSYVKPDDDSFLALLLAGGATAVRAVRSWDGKDTFRMFAARPDDFLFWTNGYDPDVFDAGFNNYISDLYKRFIGIAAGANVSIVASTAVENTVLYSIGSRIQYDAIHDYIASSYSIDGGSTWIPAADLYDHGLTTSTQSFSALHDENVQFGDPWQFVEGSTTYFVNSSEAYPMDAPYLRVEIDSIINYSGTEVHGYADTYTGSSIANLVTGVAQPSIRPDSATLPSFGQLSSISINAFFIESDLVDGEVYTNDGNYTPTPAWSYTYGGKTWYFVRDRIGYDKTWVFEESGLNGIGYTMRSSAPKLVSGGVLSLTSIGNTRVEESSDGTASIAIAAVQTEFLTGVLPII